MPGFDYSKIAASYTYNQVKATTKNAKTLVVYELRSSVNPDFWELHFPDCKVRRFRSFDNAVNVFNTSPEHGRHELYSAYFEDKPSSKDIVDASVDKRINELEIKIEALDYELAKHIQTTQL